MLFRPDTVKEIPLGGACQPEDVCADNLAQCRSSTCQCRDGYYNDQGQCREKGDVGTPCAEGGKCNDANAQCSRGLCQCKSDYSFKDGLCGECGKFLDPWRRLTHCILRFGLQWRRRALAVCVAWMMNAWMKTLNVPVAFANVLLITFSISPLEPAVSSMQMLCNTVLSDIYYYNNLRFHYYDFTSFLDRKGQLGKPCLNGNVCDDINGKCEAGICLCREGFFEKNAICSKCLVSTLISELSIHSHCTLLMNLLSYRT